MKPGWTADAEAARLGGRLGRHLGSINGQVLELSNRQLEKLADYPGVARIVHDRPIGGEMNRVALTVGAREVQHNLGFTGAGIGVAVIDSGVTTWHDDLSYQGSSSRVQTRNGQRVATFVDFVGGQTAPYDDNGHGTHVSGIIAGNGYDTRGARAGIAPDAHLVSLRVLDEQRPRRHQRRHRRARLRGREQGRSTTSASSTCRWARRSPSPTTRIR